MRRNGLLGKLGTLGLGAYLAFAPVSGALEQENDGEVRDSQRTEQVESVEREEITKANRFLRNFNENYPLAKDIEKYETAGAEKLVVHIPQVHFKAYEPLSDVRPNLRNFAEAVRNNKYRETNNYQKRIFEILCNLGGDFNNEVFAEGVSRDLTREDARKQLTYRLAHIEQGGYLKEEFKKEGLEGCGYIGGAPMIMQMNGAMKIIPAENLELNKKAEEFSIKNIGEKNPYHELREDYALKQIANHNNYLALLVYGKDHDFRNNVEEWNRDNNDKLSLMVLKPNLNYLEK